MFYAIYLVGAGLLLVTGICLRISLIPALMISLDPYRLMNFFDIWTGVFVLAICLLALLCTRNFRALLEAFAFMFTKKKGTDAQREESLLAVKTVLLAALAAGATASVIGGVNALSAMDASAGMDLSAAMLGLFYAGLVEMIFLPVYLSLKKALVQKHADSVQPVAVRPKSRKAD